MKLAFFIAAVAVAQPVALHHVPAGPAMTELGNAVRYTLYTREAPAIDGSARTITVQGTPAQVQAAHWLISEIDRPSTFASRTARNASSMYPLGAESPRRPEEFLRLYHAAGSPAYIELQEIATVIRSLLEIRGLYTYQSGASLVVRASKPRHEATEWLLARFESKEPGELPFTEDGSDPVISLFVVSGNPDPKRLVQSAAAIRAQTRIQRAFVLTTRGIFAVRGTAEQVAEAGRLFKAQFP